MKTFWAGFWTWAIRLDWKLPAFVSVFVFIFGVSQGWWELSVFQAAGATVIEFTQAMLSGVTG